MKYWLMKSEPDVFGIDDLARRPRKTEHWDGIRNYQVRNMLRDEMQKGDEALFYHSRFPPRPRARARFSALAVRLPPEWSGTCANRDC